MGREGKIEIQLKSISAAVLDKRLRYKDFVFLPFLSSFVSPAQAATTSAAAANRSPAHLSGDANQQQQHKKVRQPKTKAQINLLPLRACAQNWTAAAAADVTINTARVHTDLHCEICASEQKCFHREIIQGKT